MLKNIKYYLENETGMDFFGLFSLLVFFLFFSGLLIYVFTMKKKEMEEMKRIPLDGNNEMDMDKNIE
jgi:cbb3-type cytochrome oxidase subunit 3